MGRIGFRWWLGPWFVVVAVVVADLIRCYCYPSYHVNWLENELHEVIEIFVNQSQLLQ